jgi:hypothetical protein
LLARTPATAAADKSLVAIGVPWSIHELAPAARDAKAVGARLGLVDTPDALKRVDPALGI